MTSQPGPTLEPPSLQLSAGERYPLCARAMKIGADYLVCIWGGDEPHLGAVAMAQPRPSLAHAGRTSATASVFTYVGHKEDALAKMAAEKLSAALGTKVVVTAGMHWDGLDAEGIEEVRLTAQELVDRLLEALSTESI